MDDWVFLENFCVLKYKEYESKVEIQYIHFCMGEEQLQILPAQSPNGSYAISDAALIIIVVVSIMAGDKQAINLQDHNKGLNRSWNIQEHPGQDGTI